MPALSTAQLAQIRRLAEEHMPDTATILRRTLTDDGNGGQVESYASAGTTACRVRLDNSRSNRDEGGRITNPDYWIVNIPTSTTLDDTDRLTINSDTFEIVGPIPKGSYQASQSIRLRKL